MRKAGWGGKEVERVDIANLGRGRVAGGCVETEVVKGEENEAAGSGEIFHRGWIG